MGIIKLFIDQLLVGNNDIFILVPLFQYLIFFLVPPVVKINSPRVVVVTKGRPLTLACTASGFPVPKLVWQKNGNSLPLSATSDVSGQLAFESIQVSEVFVLKDINEILLKILDILL